MTSFPRTESLFESTKRASAELEWLYHYTSPAGLLGILESRTIWASSAWYLNDTTEFLHAQRLFSQAIANQPFDCGASTVNEFELAQDAMRRTADPRELDPYVTAFSEAGDLLSQWRAYCPPSGGYAVGFPASAIGAGTDYLLTNCVYSEEEQRSLTEAVVAEHFPFFHRRQRKDPSLTQSEFDEAAGSFVAATLTLYPALKNPHFSEEREWRLVAGLSPEGAPAPRFRTVDTDVVPYLAVPLDNRPGGLPEVQIVVGPSPQPDLAYRTAVAICEQFASGSYSIRQSLVPYRAR